MMKRLWLVLLLSFSISSVWAKKPPELPPVDMSLKQVSEHVYYVQGLAGAATEHHGFISNAAVIVTETEVVVFDALSSPALAELLIQKIKTISDKPVKKVLVSHYHADHIYGLQAFTEKGAKVFAPDGVQEYLDSDYAKELLIDRRKTLKPWVNAETRLMAPDISLEGVSTLEVGGVKLTLIPQGNAHSRSDMVVLVEPDNVLLTGDLIFAGRVPWVGNANTKVWLEQLKQLKAANAKIIIPGHGQAEEDAAKLLQLTIDYLSFLREKMGEAVEELQAFDEVYKATDWSQFEHLPAFHAANRRNAYQVYLAMEDEE